VAARTQRRLIGGGEAAVAAENFGAGRLLLWEHERGGLANGDFHGGEREGRHRICRRDARSGAVQRSGLLSQGTEGLRGAQRPLPELSARPPETAAEQQRERRNKEEEGLWGEVSHASPSGSVVRSMVR